MVIPEDDFLDELAAKLRPALLEGTPNELEPTVIQSIIERTQPWTKAGQMPTTVGTAGDVAVDGVRFKILGPIEVTNGGTPVRISPGRQQVILGALLMEPNRVVSIDRLIDMVWDDAPPVTARSQVQICVSALRHVFAGLGVEPIETRAPGYLLRVANGQLDSQVFKQLVADAAAAERDGRAEAAVELLRAALSLWRGKALGGEVGTVLIGAAVRLEDARLSALETCIDLELRLGRHKQLVSELSDLVAEYPLRERLRAQLMLALYRSGRSSDALEVYQDSRRTMVNELGLEPGEELRQLKAAILAEDQSLQLELREPPAGEPQQPAGPRQLPADIADFTNREGLLAQVETALVDGDMSSAVRVVVLTGKAGVGKTALAVHVAHRMAERRFPGGQLFCDLAGTRRKPATPSDVLGRFLRALGVPGSAIPDELDERAEMYRTLLAGRQLLVVLDDVSTVRQVTPLLPDSGSNAVIITSRTRLTDLPGARVLDVDLLTMDKAIELLSNVIGVQRVAEEPAAATALVRMVGGLPLALRIVAARLSARPHWSLASMVGRLADERHRLDDLTHGDMMVRASLRLTYEGLEPQITQLFRMLGAVTAGSIPTWVAAALVDKRPLDVAASLERLVDTQMLDVVCPDIDGQIRYGFHAIIRLFAREELMKESADARQEASERVLGGWLARVEHLHRELYGGDFMVLRGRARRWPNDADLIGSLVDPLSWLEAESSNLAAAVGQAADEGLDELCWDLAVHLVTLFETGGYADEWQQTHERALEAVRLTGNKRGEAALLCSLGSLYLSRHRLAAARAVLKPAMELFGELDDTYGIAMTQRNIALLDYTVGAGDSARHGYIEALERFREVGDLGGQAHVLSKIAQISADEGDHELATDLLTKALDICRDIGSRRLEAQVLYGLAENLSHQRRLEEADLVLSTALELARANRDLVGEGHALHTLGVVRAKLGRRAEAKELLRAAVMLRERMVDRIGAARVRLDLAPLLTDQGDHAKPVEALENPLSTSGGQ